MSFHQMAANRPRALRNGDEHIHVCLVCALRICDLANKDT